MANIIATAEADASALFGAALGRLTVLETTVNNLVSAIKTAGGPVAAALGEGAADVTGIVANVAAAVAAPNAVTIGTAVVGVTSEFGDIMDEIKGIWAGLTGGVPPNDAAGKVGAAAGEAVDNIIKGVEEGLTGAELVGPNAANPKGN